MHTGDCRISWKSWHAKVASAWTQADTEDLLPPKFGHVNFQLGKLLNYLTPNLHYDRLKRVSVHSDCATVQVHASRSAGEMKMTRGDSFFFALSQSKV